MLLEVLLLALQSNAGDAVISVGQMGEMHCTYCMSIILPEGARLSELRQPELRFLKPKNRDRRGDEAEPIL